MAMNYDEIIQDLLKMYQKDIHIREELAKTGELYEGYHPKMEQVHNKNASRLEQIIYEMGWPTVEKVGPEASYAAWVILQHAIAKPSLQRTSLPPLMDLAKKNQIMASEVAMLYDRICFFEMRPQKYGTQFDFDEQDELSPWKIEDKAHVDMYRKEMGLPPLDEMIQRMREIAKREGEKPTKSYEERLNERIAWAKKVGWIE
jgi:hypothetical protein